jgi:GGDEF domain-containing protein|eukprot:COSAG06_NODE_807_length_12165_cov_8.320902_6_plen_57_part_00
MQELDFVRKRFMLDLDDKQAADKYGHNTLDDILTRAVFACSPRLAALRCAALRCVR